MNNYVYSTSYDCINIDKALSYRDMPRGKALVELTPNVFTEVLAPLGIGYELAPVIPVVSDNFKLVTHWYDYDDKHIVYEEFPIIGWKYVDDLVYPVALGLPHDDLLEITRSFILDRESGTYRRVGDLGESEVYDDRDSLNAELMSGYRKA